MKNAIFIRDWYDDDGFYFSVKTDIDIFSYSIYFSDIYEEWYDRYNFVYSIEEPKYLDLVENIITEQVTSLRDEYTFECDWSKLRWLKNLFKQIKYYHSLYTEYRFNEKLFELFLWLVDWYQCLEILDDECKYIIQTHNIQREDFLRNSLEKLINQTITTEQQENIKKWCNLIQKKNISRGWEELQEFKQVLNIVSYWTKKNR